MMFRYISSMPGPRVDTSPPGGTRALEPWENPDLADRMPAGISLVVTQFTTFRVAARDNTPGRTWTWYVNDRFVQYGDANSFSTHRPGGAVVHIGVSKRPPGSSRADYFAFRVQLDPEDESLPPELIYVPSIKTRGDHERYIASLS